MNPIVHAELSWLLAQGLRHRRDRVAVTMAGLSPDLDGLSILGGLDAYARYHHVLFHGAVGAAVTAAACAALARRRAAVATLALVAFHLHLLCDLAGSGPGWGLYYSWPLDRTEWFWDGQWDLSSWQNMAIGLCATALCLLTALFLGRTAVEIFSDRADAAVTAAVRRRFGRPGWARRRSRWWRGGRRG